MIIIIYETKEMCRKEMQIPHSNPLHTLLLDLSLSFTATWHTLHYFDAISESQNAPNSKFYGAPPRTSLGELTVLPQTQPGGEGLAVLPPP